MASLAVDPALLYAKLEVAKLEQDAMRRAARDRKSGARRELEQRSQLQEQRVRQRESLRLSLPMDAAFTADGKPCFNTAQILAALGPSPPMRHGSTAQKHRDTSRKRDPGSESDNDVVLSMDGPKARRRFRNEGPTKLVPIKHGSQTTYEIVDVPAGTLIEDQEQQDDEAATRPRLSKYDRPHWAQQSQNASEMHLLKSLIPSHKPKKPRPQSEMLLKPSTEAPAVQRPSASVRPSNHISETLIADAVSQIKKEQRLKKLHSVSNLFRRSPGSVE